MSKVVLFGICMIAYMLYLAAGVHFQYEIGWLDWQDPYFHYKRSGWENVAPFVTPAIALLWSLNIWYKIYVLGEN